MSSRSCIGIFGLLALVIPACLSFLFDTSFNETDLLCQRGQHLKKLSNNSWICVACERLHFMDENNHQYHFCKRCRSYTKDMDKVLNATECSETSDSRIAQCVENYYILQVDNNFRCQHCKVCKRGREFCENLSLSTVISDDRTTIDPILSRNISATIPPEDSTADISDHICKDSVARTEGCLDGEYWNKSCGKSNETFMYQCLSCGEISRSSGQYHNHTTCGRPGWSLSPTIIAVLSSISFGVVALVGFLVIRRRVLAWRRHFRFKKVKTDENKGSNVDNEVSEALV